MASWIDEELRSVVLPDLRLEDRYRLLLDQLSRHPNQSLPVACGGWAETQAAYRFLDNERFDEQDLLQPHHQATRERVQQEPVVLLLQDTTELDLTRPQRRVGGPLSDLHHWGVHTHVLLAVTPQRLALGVISSHTWARDPCTFGHKRQRKNLPLAQKESRRWRDGYLQGCRLATAAPQTQVVVISDSEGDVFECFAAADQVEGRPAAWIVRACHDRNVQRVAGTPVATLWAAATAAPTVGQLEIEVQARPDRSRDGSRRRQARRARRATVRVQAGVVTLRAPRRLGSTGRDVVATVVLVREEAPPADEPAIEWLLLTSLPATTRTEAETVVGYYTCRWEVETYFRVLKSGCTVESVQVEEVRRFVKVLALYEIIAWRVLFVLRLGRECPELPCDVVFDEAEWRAVYQVVQREEAQEVPRLGQMVRWVAGLGGYLGRQGDGPPGPQTMWLGLQRTRDFALLWQALHNHPNSGKFCV